MIWYLFLALAMLLDFLLSKRSSSEEVVSLLWMACFFLLFKWQNKYQTLSSSQSFSQWNSMFWFFNKIKLKGQTVLLRFSRHTQILVVLSIKIVMRRGWWYHHLQSQGCPISMWTSLEQQIFVRCGPVNINNSECH